MISSRAPQGVGEAQAAPANQAAASALVSFTEMS